MGDKNGTTPTMVFVQNGTQCYVKHPFYDYNTVSRAYMTFTSVLFYVYLAYVVLSLIWMKSKMHVYPLSKREFSLVALSSVGGLLLFSFFLREGFGRDRYDCDTYLWTSQLVLPLLNGPIIVRLVLVYNKNMSGNKMKGMSFQRIAAAAAKLRRQQQIKNQSYIAYIRFLIGYGFRYVKFLCLHRNQAGRGRGRVLSAEIGGRNGNNNNNNNNSGNNSTGGDLTAPRGTGDLLETRSETSTTLQDSDRTIFARFGTSNTFALLASATFISPFVLSILIRSLTSPQYRHGCVGCDLKDVDFFLFAGSLVILLGACIIAFRRARHFDDPLGIMAEMRYLAYWGFGTSLPGLLLKAVDPGRLEARGIITWTLIHAVTVSSLHTVQCTWQVIKLYTKKTATYEMTLADVLEDPALREDFAQFLIAEFSFENLRFIDQVAEWKTRYESMSRFEREKMAYAIYVTFVPEESFLQVNLKSRNRVDLDRMFEGRQFEDRNALVDPPLGPDLFDKAAAEIFRMMEKDSFGRYMERRTAANPTRPPSKSQMSVMKEVSFKKDPNPSFSS